MPFGWGGKKVQEKLQVDPAKYDEVRQLNLCYIETETPVTEEHLLVYTKLKSYVDDIVGSKILWTVEEDDEKGDKVTRPVPKEWLAYLEAYCTPRELLRCLRGGQWRLTTNDVAQTELSKFLLIPPVWRIRNKIDLINGPQFAPYLTNNWIYFTESFDKMGRPIMWMKVPNDPPADWNHFAYSMLYQQEKAIRIGAERGQDRLTWIVDCEHMGLTKMPPKQMRQGCTQLLQECFVERMAVAYLVNTPWTFRAIYAVASFFVDKRTLEKVKMLGFKDSKKPEMFEQHIAPEQLPILYGGLHDFSYDFRLCEMDGDKKFPLPTSHLLDAYRKATGDDGAQLPDQWPLPGIDV